MIQDHQQLHRNTNIIHTDFDNEVVMMSLENSEYYGIDPVGSAIWELLEQPLSFEELINKLLDQFDVDADTCKKEVTVFLEDIAAKNLLEIR